MTQATEQVRAALEGRQHVCMLCDSAYADLSDLYFHVFDSHLLASRRDGWRRCWCGEKIGGPYSFANHIDGEGWWHHARVTQPLQHKLWEHFLEATCGGGAHG